MERIIRDEMMKNLTTNNLIILVKVKTLFIVNITASLRRKITMNTESQVKIVMKKTLMKK